MLMHDLMVKIAVLATVAKINFEDRLKEEKGAVDIVAIVVLIGIAVVLAVTFREQIGNLLDTLFAGISQNASKAVN